MVTNKLVIHSSIETKNVLVTFGGSVVSTNKHVLVFFHIPPRSILVANKFTGNNNDNNNRKIIFFITIATLNLCRKAILSSIE